MTAGGTRTTGRIITLVGAAMFGVFFIIAFVVRRTSIDDDHVNLVAGLLAYGFLAFVVILLLRGRRRRPGAVQRAATRYLSGHPAVVSWLGTPVSVTLPGGEDGGGSPGQMSVTVEVAGPLGSASADLVLARLGREWEVLQAVLVLDGERVRLTPSRP